MLNIESKLSRFLLLSSMSILITGQSSFAAGLKPDLNGQAPKLAAQPLDADLNGALDSIAAVELRGSASINSTHDRIGKTIDSLLESAMQQNENLQQLNKAAFRYKTPTQKAAAVAASALNYGILTRGDMPSSEGGDVILNEKLKVKSRGSAEYIRQKEMDATNLKVTAAVMEICMGLGTTDQCRAQKITANGTAALAKLVGDDQAKSAVDDLKQCAASLNIPDSVYTQDAWDIEEHQNRLDTVVQTAMDNDKMIGEIKHLVQKYNHHCIAYRVSSRVMNVGLSVVGLTPTLAGPAAQVALLAYIMATGGPEEDKLMKELYFDKRLQTRFDLLNSKAQMALDKYEVGVLTKNPMLLVCSQSVIRQITTEELTSKIFSCEFTALQPAEQIESNRPDSSLPLAQNDANKESKLKSLAHRLSQPPQSQPSQKLGTFAIPALPAIANQS